MRIPQVRMMAVAFSMLALGVGAAQSRDIGDATCNAPPRVNCPEANCLPGLTSAVGNMTEPKTGRKYFLDYPCDLKPGEKVVFVLSIHGMGSIGNWQRHFFPIVDYKDKYRLVVATPTAATDQPSRRWVAEADDVYLQNISEQVFKEFGRGNIKAFWLAGHSQGGITSRRIICSDYFKGKVDGFLSLGGGRLGPTVTTFGGAPATGRAGAAPAASPGAGRAGAAPAAPPAAAGRGGGGGLSSPELPTCDFSFIYEAGQLEIQSLPATSPWAEKYKCGPRARRPDVVDTKAGYVTATDQSRGPPWGRFARPDTAQVYVYPNCLAGRVVADVLRLDKGHTEGLEPAVMEEIVKLMVSARGGKVQGRG